MTFPSLFVCCWGSAWLCWLSIFWGRVCVFGIKEAQMAISQGTSGSVSSSSSCSPHHERNKESGHHSSWVSETNKPEVNKEKESYCWISTTQAVCFLWLTHWLISSDSKVKMSTGTVILITSVNTFRYSLKIQYFYINDTFVPFFLLHSISRWMLVRGLRL